MAKPTIGGINNEVWEHHLIRDDLQRAFTPGLHLHLAGDC
jgi:hypothetical protein